MSFFIRIFYKNTRLKRALSQNDQTYMEPLRLLFGYYTVKGSSFICCKFENVHQSNQNFKLYKNRGKTGYFTAL